MTMSGAVAKLPLSESALEALSNLLASNASRGFVARWRAAASPGYCAVTSGPGNCRTGDMGSWPLGYCEAGKEQSPTALAIWSCLWRCSQCARCSFVSISARFKDCSWFAADACEPSKLQQHPKGFITGKMLPASALPLLPGLRVQPTGRSVAWLVDTDAQPADWQPPQPVQNEPHVVKPIRIANSPECRHSEQWQPRLRLTELLDGSSTQQDYGKVTLLIGTHSGPGRRRHRQAARRTWMRWCHRGGAVAAGFLLARRHVAPAALARLEAEAISQGDVLFVRTGARDATEVCKGLSFSKSFAWWSTALELAARLPALTHIARADDDAFVHVPNLLTEVSILPHDTPYVCYGQLAYSGYDPLTYRKCGWAWQDEAARWRYQSYDCARQGAHPPMPAPLGPLQLLSRELVHELMKMPSLHHFLAHAIGPRGRNINRHGEEAVSEDILLGFWLGHLPVNVTYVNSNSRTVARVHNVQCGQGAHFMDHRVSNEHTVVAHLLKQAQAIEYVGTVLQECALHDTAKCKQAGIRVGY